MAFFERLKKAAFHLLDERYRLFAAKKPPRNHLEIERKTL